jgi:hypothetical protein
VVALAGVGGALHLAQERVHLGSDSLRPDRTLPWQAMVAATRSSASLSATPSPSSRGRSPGRAPAAPPRRGPASPAPRAPARPRPRTAQREPEFRQLVGAREQRRPLLGPSSTTSGQQQQLPAHPARLAQARLQPLVDDPLVRRVLVDQDQPVARLGQDVGRVELGAGGAQGVVGRLRHRRFRHGAPGRRQVEQRGPGLGEDGAAASASPPAAGRQAAPPPPPPGGTRPPRPSRCSPPRGGRARPAPA